MKLTYKEFVQKEVEGALKNNEWFTIEGNSELATASRTFTKEILSQVKSVNRSVLQLVDKEVLLEMLGYIAGVVVFILTPITYLPLLISRSVNSRKRAKKTMMSNYVQYLKQDEENK